MQATKHENSSGRIDWLLLLITATASDSISMVNSRRQASVFFAIHINENGVIRKMEHVLAQNLFGRRTACSLNPSSADFMYLKPSDVAYRDWKPTMTDGETPLLRNIRQQAPEYSTIQYTIQTGLIVMTP